jgi:hypothetical protein
MERSEVVGTWTTLKHKVRTSSSALTRDEEEFLKDIQRAVGKNREEVIRIINELIEPVGGNSLTP